MEEVNPLKDVLKVIWRTITVITFILVIGFSLYLEWQQIMAMGGWIFLFKLIGLALFEIFLLWFLCR